MQYASNACTIRVYFRIIRFVPVESYLYGTGTAAQLHRLSFGKETLQPMTEDNRKESGCTHTTAMQGHTLWRLFPQSCLFATWLKRGAYSGLTSVHLSAEHQVFQDDDHLRSQAPADLHLHLLSDAQEDLQWCLLAYPWEANHR